MPRGPGAAVSLKRALRKELFPEKKPSSHGDSGEEFVLGGRCGY